jgi:hypothetical protein
MNFFCFRFVVLLEFQKNYRISYHLEEFLSVNLNSCHLPFDSNLFLIVHYSLRLFIIQIFSFFSNLIDDFLFDNLIFTFPQSIFASTKVNLMYFIY